MVWTSVGQVVNGLTLYRNGSSIDFVTGVSGDTWRTGFRDTDGYYIETVNMPSPYNSYYGYSSLYNYRLRYDYADTGTTFLYAEFTPINSTSMQSLFGTKSITVTAQRPINIYLERELKNTAPTTPGVFTQPTGELETGDPKVFSVGSSSDADGNISKYVWEASINGGSFTKIGETPTNNITYTIPTAKTLKIRVKAVDSQGLESSYRESTVFTVTKPKYFWSKYNIAKQNNYTPGTPTLLSYRLPLGVTLSDSYKLNPLTGEFENSGNIRYWDSGYPNIDWYYINPTQKNVIWKIKEVNYFDSVSQEYVLQGERIYSINSPTDVRGSLIQSGIIAEEGSYPTDGQQSSYWWLRGSRVNQSIAPPGPFTAPETGTVFKPGDKAILAWGTSPAPGVTSYEPERAFNEDGQFTIIGSVKSPNTTYGITNDKTKTKVQFRVRAYDGIKGILSDYIYSDVYTIQHNVIPTILLNTANNFTMSETEGQNEVIVDGSARDTDANDNIIIKMQINDGTIRNIQSALSDGSIPIEFSKKITYSNKRVYDGATPLTNDLPENVDHTLKVWADDGQGGISTIEERKFRVIHNRPPVISGTDDDLGELLEIPSITYQVDDPEKQTATITERINGQVIRTFDAELGKEYKIEIPIEMWIPLQLEQEHKLTIEAKDTFGAKSTRTYTFTRIEDTIQLELKNPFVTDIAATRILVTPDVYLPIGSTIVIEACNNAFDEVPTWEDVTGMAMNKRGFHFTNTEKTAEQWGINIRFTLHKGTAHDQVRFNGFGGAFD
ncbi:hypothetical protein AB0Y20_15960 [Heyndrickxia oleronia]|uniref:hypothetical protein n=1 Tax=Heyndrickxia oleronia TaxID=38875 RepID=UPI003F24CB62